MICLEMVSYGCWPVKLLQLLPVRHQSDPALLGLLRWPQQMLSLTQARVRHQNVPTRWPLPLVVSPAPLSQRCVELVAPMPANIPMFIVFPNLLPNRVMGYLNLHNRWFTLRLPCLGLGPSLVYLF